MIDAYYRARGWNPEGTLSGPLVCQLNLDQFLPSADASVLLRHAPNVTKLF
jgi:hypothetical protein